MPGEDPVPEIVVVFAARGRCDVFWRNELGGLAFHLDGGFVRWNRRRPGTDLEVRPWRELRPDSGWLRFWWLVR
jgi:hypothetical protein